MTAIVERPYGYGRIVRTRREDRADRRGARRLAGAAARSREINSGIYAFDLEPLFDSAAKRSAPTTRKASTTCPTWSPSIGAGGAWSRRVTIPDAVEIRGINSRTELAEVSAMVRQQKNEELMAAGVTLDRSGHDLHRRRRHRRAPTPSSIHACFSRARTKIGSACEIHAGIRIVNSTIGDRVHRAESLR